MTSRDAKERKVRRRLIEDLKLKFLTHIEPLKWPESHKVTFGHIQKLGEKQFDQWEPEVLANWKEHPWKLDTRERANYIVEKARQCQEKRKNEREWRSELEPLVFERLSKDVSCHRCGARCWRAEVEASVDPKEAFAELLSRSKERRTCCMCPTQGPNAKKPRLNRLFSFREEARVGHDDIAKSKLNKTNGWEQPDKVFGLRQTGTLLKLLRAQWIGSDERCTLEDKIRSTLYPNDLKPDVFPFLLVEAKSAKGASFEEINDQMGILIYKCLEIQKNLQAAAYSTSQWVAGPLCWCFSCIGATWRVAAGYVSENRRIEFEVATLWTGRIDQQNGALQLLLITDYICDWARNVHREAMIGELKRLATPFNKDLDDLMSFDKLTVNSDRTINSEPTVESYHGQRKVGGLAARQVFSTPGSRQSPFRTLDRIASWEPESATVPRDKDPFRRFDSPAGVIRDAKFIQSKVMGLCISESTFELLVNCVDSDKESTKLLGKVMRILETEEPLFMDHSALTDLENAWTGYDRSFQERDLQRDLSNGEDFHVLLTFSAFITSEWEPTRELCYLAISKSAKELLYRKIRSGRQRSLRGTLMSPSGPDGRTLQPDAVAQFARHHLDANVRETLTASLYRSSTQPRMRKKTPSIDDDTAGEPLFEDENFTYSVEPRTGKGSRELVWSLYRRHQVGRNEPSTPLLRVSSRLDKQSLTQQHGSSSPWSSYNIQSSEIAVLAHSPPIDGTSLAHQATDCIFVIDRMQATQLLPMLRATNRSFKYCFLTERVVPIDSQEMEWNVTYDIQKRGASKRGEVLLAHVERSLELDKAADSELSSQHGTDGDYSPESSSESDEYSTNGTDSIVSDHPEDEEAELEQSEDDSVDESVDDSINDSD